MNEWKPRPVCRRSEVKFAIEPAAYPCNVLTVETHAHTYRSGDCLMRPDRIVAVCRRRGIDRLCVTDHNTIRGALELAALAPELVVVGEEIRTTRGELLGYFLREQIPHGLSPHETIARLREQGAAISISHPFDYSRKGAWAQTDLLDILPLVDAIEVFNSRALSPAANERALAFAHKHATLGTAGSDAHSYGELGRAGLRLPDFDDAAGFIAALAHAVPVTRRSSPFIHLTSRWATIWKRIAGDNQNQ